MGIVKRYFIVWNQNKTIGFITSDPSLAYEARKGSDSNCYDENGNKCNTAIGFCEDTLDDNCKIIIVNDQNIISHMLPGD